MTTLQRFIGHIGEAAGLQRTYSAQSVIAKLEKEIEQLHVWLVNNEPGSDTWREKRSAMLRKMNNLQEIKEENNL